MQQESKLTKPMYIKIAYMYIKIAYMYITCINLLLDYYCSIILTMYFSLLTLFSLNFLYNEEKIKYYHQEKDIITTINIMLLPYMTLLWVYTMDTENEIVSLLGAKSKLHYKIHIVLVWNTELAFYTTLWQ